MRQTDQNSPGELQGDANENGNATRAAIVVKGLAKRFKSASGGVQALKGVNFEVAREKVFTILGPNGAGKTTLLRILTNVMKPTSGTAWIEGFEIGRQNIHIRQLIGIVAQDNHFDKYLTVWQNLVLHAQMHGLEKAVYERRIKELLERVDLYDRRDDNLDDFSGGMQRRVALIRALIHEPKLLFLDEPTTGLDPVARREIWDTILELKRNTTVILTTHYMEEADRLSDYLMILNHGEVMMSGTAEELKRHLTPPNTYELYLTTPTAREILQRIEDLVHDATLIADDAICFKLNRPQDLSVLMQRIPPDAFKSIGLAEADLETVYITVAKQAARELKTTHHREAGQ